MSRKIDERVVELKFNTKDFENGVKNTTENLAQLEQALNMEGVGSAIENISSKFSAFGAIAFTAIQTLTNSAIGFGNKIAGAVLDPLIEGGKKRALNIEQAKFQFKGLGMDVEQSMADALYAVKGTAFGLDEAAVAASQFGASGIKSGAEMQSALRGISGVAAMAGSSYTDMANVFTKVAGQGRLMGDDLNRLGTRGINAASTLADYFNKTGLAVNATEADIRSMVTKGEIDFATFAAAMSDAFGEHATKANETYTGSLSNLRAALARIGAMYFTPELERMRTIFNALTPLIDSVATAITPLINAFNKLADQAVAKFVKSLEGIQKGLDAGGMSRITYIMTMFSDAVVKIGDVVGRIFGTIGRAFQDTFGTVNSDAILGLVRTFSFFAGSLKYTDEAATNTRTTFMALFGALKLVFDIIGAAGKIAWSIFSNLFKLIGSILGVFSPVLDIFRKFQRSTDDSSNSISSFADKVTSFIDGGVKPLISFFENLKAAMDNLIKTKLGSFITDMSNDFKPLESLGSFIVNVFRALETTLSGVWTVVKPIFDNLKRGFDQLMDGFKNLTNGMDFSLIFNAANTGILFWFANSIKNLFSGGIDEIGKITGIFGKISDIFEGVTGTLEAMQTKLKAEALMKIALAIGILAASMFLLGSINPENIGSAVAGMVTVTTAMIGVMFALDKLTTMKGAAKLPFIAASMIMVATSLLVLSVALKIMSTMSWQEMAIGLISLAGAMGIMIGAVLLLSNAGPKALLGAAALAILSTSLLALALTMKILGSMSWESIAKGLVALAGAMLIMVGAVLLLGSAGPMAIVGALALAVLSASLLLIASALAIMGTMSWESIGKSMVALAGSLIILLGAVAVMGAIGPLAIAGALAIGVLAVALTLLAGVIFALGSMDMGTLIQGLIGMGVALALLVGAVAILGLIGPVAIMGAAAILIISAALLVLTISLTALAMLPAEGIAQALITIAAALGIMLVAGLLFGSLSQVLLVGAGVMALMAVALLLIAASMAIFAISLGIFAMNAGPAAEGLTLLVEALMNLGWGIAILAAAGLALIAFGVGALIAGAGISILAIGLALMAGALALIAITAPMGSIALTMLVMAMVPLVAEGLKLAALGAAFLVLGAGLVVLGVGALLAGAGLIVLGAGMMVIAATGPKGVKALEKVVEAIAGMIFQLPQMALMAAGFAALGAALLVLGAGAMLAGAGSMILVAGLMLLAPAAMMASTAMTMVAKATTALTPSVPALAMIASAVGLLGVAFAAAAGGGAAAAAGILAMVASTAIGTASVILFASTISAMIPMAIAVFALLAPASSAASIAVVKSFMEIQNGILRSIPASTMAVNALVVAIAVNLISQMNAQAGNMYNAGYNTGRQMSSGMASGINSGRSSVINAAISVASAALSAMNNRLDIRSPSRKTMWSGKMMDEGLELGMLKNQGIVVDAAENVADAALVAMRDAMSTANDFILKDIGTDPVIRPVLDLSSIKKDASALNGMLSNETIPVQGNYNSAANLAARHNQALEERNSISNENVENVQNVIFNQNISSPKAINTSEVYRNTKNQISVTKEELKSK